MNDLTIIIPLIEYTSDMKEYYDKSFSSLFNADKNEELNVIIIGPSSAIKESKKYEWGERDVLFLENEKNTSLQHQINKAVKDVKTEYFSILEFDDRYTSFWFDEVKKYMEAYPNVSLYLPLIEIFDAQVPELGAVAYANEPVWSSAFVADELGYIDLESLKNHFNFIVSGGVFKKSDFIGVGGLKNTLNVFFWYEFLLRLCHNSKTTMVIPKVGYEHVINRENALSMTYQSMEKEELDFWFNTAQEEYVYKSDRKKIYSE